MDRGETLDEARKCVCEDRNKTYKEPEDNFNNIANYWNIFLDSKLGFNEIITAVDVGIMMTLLKIARMAGEPIDDNFVDAIGYLACACEIADKEFAKEAGEKPAGKTEFESIMKSLNEALEKAHSMGELE